MCSCIQGLRLQSTYWHFSQLSILPATHARAHCAPLLGQPSYVDFRKVGEESNVKRKNNSTENDQKYMFHNNLLFLSNFDYTEQFPSVVSQIWLNFFFNFFKTFPNFLHFFCQTFFQFSLTFFYSFISHLS